MKRMFLALVATMTMTAAMAQGDNQQFRGERQRMDRTEMTKRRTENTVKQYGLNEEQAAKLLALNTKYADKIGGGMRGMRRGGGPGMRGGRPGGQNGGQRPELTEEQKQQMEAQRKEQQEAMKQYDIELQAIMTQEQYTAYKADMEKRMKEGGRRGGGPRGNGPRGDNGQN